MGQSIQVLKRCSNIQGLTAFGGRVPRDLRQQCIHQIRSRAAHSLARGCWPVRASYPSDDKVVSSRSMLRRGGPASCDSRIRVGFLNSS